MKTLPISKINLNKVNSEVLIGKNAERIIYENTICDGKIILEEGSKLIYVLFATDGWEGNPKLTFEMNGMGAEITFLAFILGSRNARFEFETVSRHSSPQTTGKFIVRAALFDNSLVDYKGNLKVPRDAHLTDTYLAHHTLLLSDKARARTIPSLEIEADDVKAGHSATLGKVDDEHLFYLKSRGIGREEAQSLLIHGFFETQLRMISDEKLQQVVRREIRKNLSLIS